MMKATISSDRLPRFQERLTAGAIYSISDFDVARLLSELQTLFTLFRRLGLCVVFGFDDDRRRQSSIPHAGSLTFLFIISHFDVRMWHCHGSEGDSDTERISNLSYPWSLKPLITRKSEASSALHAPSKEGDVMHSQHLKSFTLDELENATGNFCPESLIGGGFGFVYKGCINGGPRIDLAVDVKKLKTEGFQGHKEWQREVDYLGRLHHPNLVKFIGYSLEDENSLLIYEYMPNGSLENHLFERGSNVFSWSLRMKIAIGAARGLCFLHDAKDQVIYRDFKASNILLDSGFNAKLSDFGLAREGPKDDRSHVTTEVIGTQGYAAPEYLPRLDLHV
ncbi:hypothetical protein F2Q70_00015430 [Brassica cretica]|uniref:non-specific serine/threonine protein kinase n=1 Tax=Brassica cretica TaxID=69181 RepID=A0A8S9HRJ0_BRACR|nr:hypothetical protein F2Q70_00015430 [Brassica cretica]